MCVWSTCLMCPLTFAYQCVCIRSSTLGLQTLSSLLPVEDTTLTLEGLHQVTTITLTIHTHTSRYTRTHSLTHTLHTHSEYTHMYTHTFARTNAHTHMYTTRKHMHMCTHTPNTPTHTYTHTYTHTHTHAHTHTNTTHTHTHTINTHTHTQLTHTHTTRLDATQLQAPLGGRHVCEVFQTGPEWHLPGRRYAHMHSQCAQMHTHMHMCAYTCPGLTELLMAPGKYPGSSGTRNLHDNLSDIRAQVAANQKVGLHNKQTVYIPHDCHRIVT